MRPLTGHEITLFKGRAVMNVTVREIMKKEVITLFEADTLRHAFEIMSKK
jgi:CBS domain-containing protein